MILIHCMGGINRSPFVIIYWSCPVSMIPIHCIGGIDRSPFVIIYWSLPPPQNRRRCLAASWVTCKSGRPLPRNLADSCELTETTEPRQPSISRGRAVRANDPDPLHRGHQPLPVCHHLLVMSCPLRCRANLTQIRQSRLDAGLGLSLLLGKVVLKLVFLFSLGGVLTPRACVSQSAPLSPVPRLLFLP